MKRFFFNVKTPCGMIDDPEGVSLPSLQKVAEFAEASMREMIADAFKANRQAPTAIRVVDDQGAMIITITAKEIAKGLL